MSEKLKIVILGTAHPFRGGLAAYNERLAKQLEKCGHFPQTVVEMISVAEESNSLDSVLVTISENLERTTFRRLETVVRLLEPMMLLLLAAMVMFVVLALMIPILNSSNAL